MRDFFHDKHEPFDVVIVGGGVMGACVHHRLTHAGYRTLLVDQNDFAGATSQASAMLVWGGLLYLKNLEVVNVLKLSASRDALLRSMPDRVEPHRFSFIFGDRPYRSPAYVQSGLWLYWLLGRGRRAIPWGDDAFAEQSFLNRSRAKLRLRYEEGRLRTSDASFVLDWITQSPGTAVNYCRVVGGGFDRSDQCWRLQLQDRLGSGQVEVKARHVINAAGVWTDRLNALFHIESPWQHLCSKGVSISIPRPRAHRDTLVFDSADADEGLSLVPWGPVSLWGSTETLVRSPDEGWHANSSDVTYLLEQLNAYVAEPVDADDIISLRCGLRPLVVPRGTTQGNSLELSRRWKVHVDHERQWISIYGGKMTACVSVAEHVRKLLKRHQPTLAVSHSRCAPARSEIAKPPATPRAPSELDHFPGLDRAVPGARWSRDHQMCCTLDDYLRRRTNIAQWIPRGGLGRFNENRPRLIEIATNFCASDMTRAEWMVDDYEERITRERTVLSRTTGVSPVSSNHNRTGETPVVPTAEPLHA